MIRISLVCLLALSISAFGYSLGAYSQIDVPELRIRPTLPAQSRDQSLFQAPESRRLTYDSPEPVPRFPNYPDILCKGKPADFVILVNEGEKFIVCTTDGRGDEFFCPKGLLYSSETHRCEHKFQVNKNVCDSQPCLFGGRCIPTQYSYECECAPGFSGRTCELDASVCQEQQPCGDYYLTNNVCQSFPVGAALKYVCILDDGDAYCLNHAQRFSNPCFNEEGYHPLAFGNEGFIMCNGERMSIESCPGGTVWDPSTEACSWSETTSVVSSQAQARRSSNGPSRGAFRPISSGTPAAALPGQSARALGGGVDFTERFAGGQFQAAAAPGRQATAGRVSAGSSNDFTQRFDGGDFQRIGGAQGGPPETARVVLAAAPGASRDGQNQVDFNSPLPPRLSNDDSTSSSIPVPFRSLSSGNGEMKQRGMIPSSFFGRPGEARRSS